MSLEYSDPMGVIIGKLTLIGKLTEEVESILQTERGKGLQIKSSDFTFSSSLTKDQLAYYCDNLGVTLID